MPRGTDNPPELVIGAKFHMINPNEQSFET